jgi:transposase
MWSWIVKGPAIARSFLCVFFISFSSLALSTDTGASLSACSSAVSKTQAYVKAKRQLAAARFNANAMTSDEYQQRIVELDDAEASVSMDKCLASKGVDLELYYCLADNKGNYAICR